MLFESIKNPNDLMNYLDENFQYGVIDNNGKKFYDSSTEEFQDVCNNQWKLRSVDQLLEDKIGHCYDQVEIEREWFEKNGYEIKTFWICAYQTEIENFGFTHSYLVYKENDNWNIFEHSDYFNRGIHSFRSLNDAVKWQAESQIKFATSQAKPLTQYVTSIKEFTKPPINLDMQKYIDFINTFEDYEI